MKCAFGRNARSITERLRQESDVLGFAHFSASAVKFRMFDTSATLHIRNSDVVGRIREHHPRSRTLHKAIKIAADPGITAQEAMTPQVPQIPPPRNFLLVVGGYVVLGVRLRVLICE
jgi:hypothetical protein